VNYVFSGFITNNPLQTYDTSIDAPKIRLNSNSMNKTPAPGNQAGVTAADVVILIVVATPIAGCHTRSFRSVHHPSMLTKNSATGSIDAGDHLITPEYFYPGRYFVSAALKANMRSD
jgi:hypothetical protein